MIFVKFEREHTEFIYLSLFKKMPIIIGKINTMSYIFPQITNIKISKY